MNGAFTWGKNIIQGLVEKFPNTSLALSAGGAVTSILSVLKIVSIVFGAAGAVFSAIAGYYVMRYRRREFLKHKK